MNNSTFLLVGFIVFLISGSIAVFYLPEVISEEIPVSNISNQTAPNATSTGEFIAKLIVGQLSDFHSGYAFDVEYTYSTLEIFEDARNQCYENEGYFNFTSEWMMCKEIKSSYRLESNELSCGDFDVSTCSFLPTESDLLSLTDSITKPTPIRRNLVEEYWNLCDTFFFNECYIVGAY